MGKLIAAFMLIAIILLGFILPKAYNDNFLDKYKQGIINMWLSLLCAVTIFFFWSALSYKETIWPIVSFILMIGTVSYTGIAVFLKSKQLTKSTSSALVSVLMQFLSIAGFVIVIALVVAVLVGGDGKKKERR